MKLLMTTVLLAILIGAAHGAPPRQLPELTLQSVSGESILTEHIQFPGSWLLVYLSGNEKIDRDLLSAMQVFYEQPSAGKVVLCVPGATPNALGELKKSHQKLAALRWLADSDRSAAGALQLSGSAMIMGMRGFTIQWSVAGSGKDQNKLRSLLVDWVK